MGFANVCTWSFCILVSVAVIALFSSFADIWIQTAGCTVSPQLGENLEKIQELQDIESKKRDNINHNWNAVFAKQQHLDELERSFHHLHKWIYKLDPLKSDIISLLDVKILNKTGKDRREIENKISSNSFNRSIFDVNQLKQNIFTDVEFALSLLINVGSCIVACLVWKYMHKTGDKLGKLESKTYNTKCGYNTAKQIGQVVVGLLILGNTINNIASFDEECRNRELQSYEMINTIVTSTQSMQIIEERMRIFDENVTQNYKFLYDQLKSKEMNEFVKETIQLTLFIKDKTLKLAKARHSLHYFYKKFNKAESALHEINYKHVKMSLTQLLTGFSNIDYKLDCYRRKRNVINSITRKCASGEDNYENLWENVKNEQGSLEVCIGQKYLSMKEIHKTIQLNMEKRKKSNICIRNSKPITDTVCENWLNNMNNFDIMNSIDLVTLEDVQEIIKKCLPADVSPNIHDRICYLKSNNAKLINTIKSNSNFNSTQIKSIYNACSLTQLQKKYICSKKKDGYKIAEIHNLYIYYQEAMIVKQYESCIAEITPAIVNRICSLSKWNVDNDLHKLDVKTFGREAVLDILRKEC